MAAGSSASKESESPLLQRSSLHFPLHFFWTNKRLLTFPGMSTCAEAHWSERTGFWPTSSASLPGKVQNADILSELTAGSSDLSDTSLLLYMVATLLKTRRCQGHVIQRLDFGNLDLFGLYICLAFQTLACQDHSRTVCAISLHLKRHLWKEVPGPAHMHGCRLSCIWCASVAFSW